MVAELAAALAALTFKRGRPSADIVLQRLR